MAPLRRHLFLPDQVGPLRKINANIGDMTNERFAIHDWDDGCVVFDRLSGDTHALDPLAAELLALPEGERGDIATASFHLDKLLMTGDPSGLHDRVAIAFEQLRLLNLI